MEVCYAYTAQQVSTKNVYLTGACQGKVRFMGH